MSDVSLTTDIHDDDLTLKLFYQHAAKEQFVAGQYVSWATNATKLDLEGFVVLRRFLKSSASALVTGEGMVARITLSDGTLGASMAGESEEALDAAVDLLRQLFAPTDPLTDEKRVSLWLWTMGMNGPSKYRRMIDVPSFGDIENNYAGQVRDQLLALMEGRPENGKIILWSGPAGTGKTYALRALGYEWRAWCDLHYIVDPEIAFGQQAAYLLTVLLDAAGDGGPEADVTERWKLLVLEDTGEMLTKDAKSTVGQALSRLLNVTDGLIGQGLRVLVLVSTNEDIGVLHDAVLRPGRCASNITFKPLSAAESEAWLASRGVNRPTGQSTIAQLYGIAAGDPLRADPPGVGFLRSVR